MNTRAQDLRLGIWRIHVLHQASLRPVWPGMLLDFVAGRGHHVPSSIMSDAVAFMVAKGWLAYIRPPRHGNARPVRLTPAGSERLHQLRKQIADLHNELQGDTQRNGATIEENLIALIRRNRDEIAKMQRTLTNVQSVLAEALD